MPSSDLSYYLAWLKDQLKPQVTFPFHGLAIEVKDIIVRAMNIFKVFVEVYK